MPAIGPSCVVYLPRSVLLEDDSRLQAVRRAIRHPVTVEWERTNEGINPTTGDYRITLRLCRGEVVLHEEPNPHLYDMPELIALVRLFGVAAPRDYSWNGLPLDTAYNAAKIAASVCNDIVNILRAGLSPPHSHLSPLRDAVQPRNAMPGH